VHREEFEVSLFQILKWLHVLSAIIAVGANATYGFWLARSAKNPDALPFTLRSVKMLDDRIANPAYGALLITGLAMVFTVPIPITTPWILSGLILYVAIAVLGFFVYTPILRKQIALAESEGPQSAAYKEVARRGTIIGIVVAVIALAIVFLMVVKPPLWG
jgi:uncharacterized membrane protein